MVYKEFTQLMKDRELKITSLEKMDKNSDSIIYNNYKEKILQSENGIRQYFEEMKKVKSSLHYIRLENLRHQQDLQFIETHFNAEKVALRREENDLMVLNLRENSKDYHSDINIKVLYVRNDIKLCLIQGYIFFNSFQLIWLS